MKPEDITFQRTGQVAAATVNRPGRRVQILGTEPTRCVQAELEQGSDAA